MGPVLGVDRRDDPDQEENDDRSVDSVQGVSVSARVRAGRGKCLSLLSEFETTEYGTKVLEICPSTIPGIERMDMMDMMDSIQPAEESE